MNGDWHEITCTISCASRGTLRPLREMAARETDLDHTITRTLEYGPGDIERQTYRLGDYFDNIQMQQDEPHGRLEIVFHVRQDVDSHWKDLVMAILRSLNKSFADISIEFPPRST
jgi:hypothetical protein